MSAKQMEVRAVGVVHVVMAVEGYDLGIYGTLLPLIMGDEHLGVDTGDAGVIGSAAFLGMLLGGLSVGMLSSRIGRRRVLTYGVLLFSAAMFGAALAPSVPVLIVARLLAGCGLGVVMPMCMARARAGCTARTAPLGISITMAGVPAGGILAACLAWGTAAELGWRMLFAVGGALGLLVLPILLRTPEPADEGKPMVSHPVGLDLGKVWRVLCAGSAATFFFLLTFYGLVTWLTKLMTVLEIPLTGALQLTLVLNVGAVLGSLLTGFLAVRHGSLGLTVISGIGGAVCLLLTGSGILSGLLLLAVVGVCGMFAPSTQNLVNSLVADAVDAADRAAVLGVTLGIGRCGAIAAPLIGSFLLSTVPDGRGLTGPAGMVFVVFAGSSLLGVAASCWLGALARQHSRDAAEETGGAVLVSGVRAAG